MQAACTGSLHRAMSTMLSDEPQPPGPSMSWHVTAALSTVKAGDFTCAGPPVATSCHQAAAGMAPETGIDAFNAPGWRALAALPQGLAGFAQPP